MIDAPYDEWIPYVDYEKAECDVKLKDGSIVYHCWPNAGKFNPLCSDRDEVPEEDVEYIMYRKYYRDDLCKLNCNGDRTEFLTKPNSRSSRAIAKMQGIAGSNEYIDWEELAKDGVVWSSQPNRTPPVVNTEPKIQRNDPCFCGSGKKFKKCCINK